MSEEQTTTNESGQDDLPFLKRKSVGGMPTWLVLILALLALGFFALLCSGGTYFITRQFTGGSAAVDPTPTPFSETGVDIPVNPTPAVIILSDTDTITMSLDIPTAVTIDSRGMSIQPQLVDNGGELTPTSGTDTAVWLYGSIVNYVLLLNNTPENQTLLEQLAPGDAMVLRTESGNEIPYTFASREHVLANDQDVYAQTSPGITLILAGGKDEDRLVITGHYNLDAVSQTVNESVAELGEPVQLEDLQITVNGAAYQLGNASQGFGNYLVDYQIQNIGLTAVDTSEIQYLLIDDFGNQYAHSPTVSQQGNHPPLTGFLNANQTEIATAGFQIPAGLYSSKLRFVVMRGAAQAAIVIPFQDSPAADAAHVTLISAVVSPDRTTLALNGQITNLGQSPLVVVESDVKLTTADGATYWMLSTNPAFPWTIPPGQPLAYNISFQVPTSEPAVFTILNQPFELTALR